MYDFITGRSETGTWADALARIAPLLALTLAFGLYGCNDEPHGDDDDDDDSAATDDDTGDDDTGDDDTGDDDTGSGEEDAGCYAIAAADVDDSCLDESAEINAQALALLNQLLSAAGEDEISNPVDLSALAEEGLEQYLMGIDDIKIYYADEEELAQGSVEMTLPNPMVYEVDEDGNVTGYGEMTVTCTMAGTTLTCDAEEITFNATALLVSAIVGYPVPVEQWECWVTMDILAMQEYGGLPQTLDEALEYTLTVDQENCNDNIEQFFDDPSQSCGMESQISWEFTHEPDPMGYCG